MTSGSSLAHLAPDELPLDANQRTQASDPAGKSGTFRRHDNRADVLVRAWRFLGDTSRRWAVDQDSLRGQFINDLAPTPPPQRRVTGERPAGTMAG